MKLFEDAFPTENGDVPSRVLWVYWRVVSAVSITPQGSGANQLTSSEYFHFFIGFFYITSCEVGILSHHLIISCTRCSTSQVIISPDFWTINSMDPPPHTKRSNQGAMFDWFNRLKFQDGKCHESWLKFMKQSLYVHSLKLSFSHLEMDGWKTRFLLGFGPFSGAMLVSGMYIWLL